MKRFLENFVLWTGFGLIYLIVMTFGVLLLAVTFKVLWGIFQ